MVQFNENTDKMQVFTASITGDKEDYLSTIKTLLNIISGYREDNFDQSDLYNICNLIKGMLPDEKQIVSLEDAQYLEAIKQNNNNTASKLL